MSEPVRGVVVAHASLAEGLVASVLAISGMDGDALKPLTNEGCGPESLQARVNGALPAEGPAIVFTDMGSGSCAFAARRIALDRPDTGIVTGVNLPVLLDFVFHREMPLAELVERLVEKGRGGITGAHREAAAHADRAIQGR
jgi:mannose/fructose-specific phosphotransferase system component IIA